MQRQAIAALGSDLRGIGKSLAAKVSVSDGSLTQGDVAAAAQQDQQGRRRFVDAVTAAVAATVATLAADLQVGESAQLEFEAQQRAARTARSGT